MAKFHVITCFFNPCGFKSLLRNYHFFSSQLKHQGVPLLTIECVFGSKNYEIDESQLRVKSNSILWQKERLLNHAMNYLPDDCEYIAFIDCDILFSCGDWHEKTIQVLNTCDLAQVFQKVGHLAKDEKTWDGEIVEDRHPGIAWQVSNNPNWLWKRKNNELPWAHPGFGWAFRRDFIQDLGLYDKSIVGGGDGILTDCLFDSFYINKFTEKFNQIMIDDIMQYCKKLRQKKPKIGYVPVEIGHLYHGSLDFRNYTTRYQIFKYFDFDPKFDIVINNGVWEWNSNKIEMHDFLRKYFMCRKEDT